MYNASYSDSELVRLRQEVSFKTNPVSMNKAKHNEINKKNTEVYKVNLMGHFS